MNRHINSIANRLSLRVPQKDSLEILARISEIIKLEKRQDVAAALETIKSEFPSVEDFEREFPSLCFALATGVGKTRLMGAFIAYLHLVHGMKHFFVLAPNLTIYNKLIADFTPNTKKYVFQGIAEFAINPPEIITGDNYESGRGIRGVDLYGRAESIHINVFNISKINSEVRGGKAPRIKRLSEYVGESYFEYLSKLDDLVLLMDESHRYRASAGVKAINELNPVIGLELTATPQVEAGARSTPFKNVIYSYPLFKAMEDGYVKEPAVATRENFDAKAFTEEQLEHIKLEDSVCIHENVKAELKVYADNNGKPYVEPFILVVAQDTGHAEKIMAFIKSDDFFGGKYKDRVITVHSAQTGEEKDDTVQRLLSIEDASEPTEIVIHVNMLKEGWDVTNLYTIVPLRAANSRTLVEQSIGRGLRLPYGKRTGVPAVDRLTIVAHDKFDEIIKEANDKNSIIRVGVVIGKDISAKPKQAVEIKSNLDMLVEGVTTEQKPLFTEVERPVAQKTLQVIKEFEKLPSSRNLQLSDVQQQIIERVEEIMTPAQGTLDGVVKKTDVAAIVRKVTEAYIQNTIDIPRVIVSPIASDSFSFDDFNLDTSELPRLQPVDDNILIQHLRTAEREQMAQQQSGHVEDRLEDYIVAALIDFDDISYDDHADLLYKLAGQMTAFIESYVPEQNARKNIVQFHRKKLADLIHAQMTKHIKTNYSDYQASVTRGFERPKMGSVTINSAEKVRPFRMNVDQKQDIRGMIFEGFKKCLYPQQKFDSDSERQMSVLLEDDKTVLKWFKPGRNDVRIYYNDSDGYEPDFVIETDAGKILCEVKRVDEIDDDEVQQKAKAAKKWCEFASAHEKENNGKPWTYLLVPHNAIKSNTTLSGLISQFTS